MGYQEGRSLGKSFGERTKDERDSMRQKVTIDTAPYLIRNKKAGSTFQRRGILV